MHAFVPRQRWHDKGSLQSLGIEHVAPAVFCGAHTPGPFGALGFLSQK
jgi:hypothetical protein